MNPKQRSSHSWVLGNGPFEDRHNNVVSLRARVTVETWEKSRIRFTANGAAVTTTNAAAATVTAMTPSKWVSKTETGGREKSQEYNESSMEKIERSHNWFLVIECMKVRTYI